jgi:hypothetical protein
MQNKLIIGGALALALGSAATFAVEKGEVLATDVEAVRQALESQGYQVRKIEAEDSDGDKAIEAYAMKDNTRFEIYVDRQTGAVARVKQDD